MTLLLSEILDKQSLLIPDFSTAFQFRLINNREYFLKASISRNSRIPTMNDLFWSDIGNPDLKNEYAYNYELTYKMILNSSSPLSFTSDISIFHNDIKNMIEWHPGDNAIWTVDNIGRVNSEGVESTISVVYKADKFTGHFNAGYSFTKASAMKSYMANDASVGKQLIYIPENQLNGSLRLSFGNFYSSWLVNLTGKEFTTSDDSKFLPSYVLNSIITGIKLHLSGTSIDLNLNIDNLFAVNYQTVAGYPLPGRSYFLKILFQFVK
jgi:iron complex outermembrane receptor protein